MFNNFQITTSKINNDISFIKIKENKVINKKKINHIVVIDNFSLNKDLNEIISRYPKLIEVYNNYTNIENLYLISTYPKVKSRKIKTDDVYIEFRKIIIHKKGYLVGTNILLEMINECENIIKEITTENVTEIIIFTNINYNLVKEEIELINKLSNQINVFVSVIGNEVFADASNICLISIDSETEKQIDKIYENVIKEGIFLQFPNNLQNLKIKLEKTYLIGKNINEFDLNLNNYNTFLISSGDDQNISINEEIYIMNELEKSKNINVSNLTQNILSNEILFAENNNNIDILNGIEFMLNLLTNEMIVNLSSQVNKYIKEFILNCINLKKSNYIKNKAIILYSEYKKIQNKILEKQVSDINIEENNNNLKIIAEYGKKSKIIYSKQKFKNMMDNRIISNVTKIKDNCTEKSSEDIVNFIKINDNLSNNIFNSSCEFFSSPITLSNWFDEIKNGNGMGLLLKISTNDLAKIGILDNILIDEINTTFFPIIDFVISALDYFEKNKNMAFGDLNKKNIISGMAIGDANAILPIYINKYHWKIVKPYIEQTLGIIISYNPYGYSPSHKNFFFLVFNEMTIELFTKEAQNEKFIKCFISVMRTCAEICFENKFNYGIKKLISDYVKYPLCRISKSKYPYDNLFSQSLVTGYILNNDIMKKLLIYILEELLRLFVKSKKYSESYIDYIINLHDEEFDKEVDIIITSITNKIQYDLKNMISYYHCNNIFLELFKLYGSYSKFIKSLEENFGMISNDKCKKILEITEKIFIDDNIEIKKLYELLSVEYNKYNIIYYILEGIRNSKNKIRKNSIENNKYLDIIEINITKELLINKFQKKNEIDKEYKNTTKI